MDEVVSSVMDEVMKGWSKFQLNHGWSDEVMKPQHNHAKLKKQNAFSNSNVWVLVAPWVNYAQVRLELSKGTKVKF